MAWKYILPENMFDVFEHLSDNEAGQIIKKIGSYLLDKEDIQLSDKLEGLFLAYISQLNEDKNNRNAFIKKQRENPLGHGRPKKDWDNSQKAKKAKKAKKASNSIVSIDIDNNIIYIINKEDILNIITEEEIPKIKNELNILMKLISMGYKLEKKKSEVYDFVDWLKDMVKQFIPLKENGTPNRPEAMKLVDGRVDYRKSPPKGKLYPTNFRSSVRNTFSIFTKTNG